MTNSLSVSSISFVSPVKFTLGIGTLLGAMCLGVRGLTLNQSAGLIVQNLQQEKPWAHLASSDSACHLSALPQWGYSTTDRATQMA
jgi:hypothetical protein